MVQTLKKIIERIKYKEYLNSLDFEERNENVVELINAIDTYEKENNDSNIEHYLQEVALYTDNDDKKKKENSVSLMTIHTAKGTEFPIIFITAFNEGVFPPNEMTKDINMGEERRVAYVGITRAMDNLFITSSHGSTFFGKTSPSRFIYEIGLNKFKQHEFEHTTISKADLSWYDSKKPIDYSDNYNKESIDFKIGDTVVHTTFGSGLIIGMMNDDMLEILFKAPYGRKILIKTHKALKRLRH
jgi:DNA helicase-2/ATP-dependent DNA helicase PcrA